MSLFTLQYNKMLTGVEDFDIRSVSSSDINQQSLRGSAISNSLESCFVQDEEISDTIRQLILEEKKKNFVSKTQQFYEPDNLKRSYSLSYVHSKKQIIPLPYHLKNYLLSFRKCPNIAINDTLDSIYGAFFGYVLGDAIGSHVAYKIANINDIPSALLMNGGGTYNIGPGQGTDLTELFLSCCYGLIGGNGKYSQNLMAKRYLEWMESRPFNISAIFLLSMTQLRKNKHNSNRTIQSIDNIGDTLKKSSLKNKIHQSNIGLIRVLPLAVWGISLSESQFCRLIRDELSLICPNELVIESGIVFGLMLRTIFSKHDHELAFYETSKWVYNHGSQKLKDLWKHVQLDIDIQSRGNMGKLKTCFTYAFIQANKREVNFLESLLRVLLKGGDTDANASIVLALVGSIAGYNAIPNYFKHKITNFRMKQSPRPRSDEFSPFNIIQIVQKLLQIRPTTYEGKSDQ